MILYQQLLELHPIIIIIFLIIIGLCIGSFLNVVIYRLPIILEQNFQKECQEFLNLPKDKISPHFSLAYPHSHCPHCQKTIPLWRNIPLLSFILQKGKCAFCGKRISWRYPLIECITAIFTVVTVFYFGLNFHTLAVLFLTWALIVLFFIDCDHQLLPDNITLPFIWLGLLCNMFQLFTTLESALLGAVAGYVALWIIGWLFKKIRGIDGIGHGDYKLLAMLGAWFGITMLPFLVLISAILGLVFGIATILIKKYNRQTPFPFGPYLAIAGWVILFWGNDILHWYLNLFF